MAKLYQPSSDILKPNYSVTENPNPRQEGIPCPFITGSLQLCPKKFVIESREMTKLIEHVLSHIPNIILEKVSELIQAASKIYPDSKCGSGCPLPYCSLVMSGMITEHFLEHHKMELSIFILKSISKSDSKLLEQISRFLDDDVLDFKTKFSASLEPKTTDDKAVKTELDSLNIPQQEILTPPNMENSFAEADTDVPGDLYADVGRNRYASDVHEITENNSDMNKAFVRTWKLQPWYPTLKPSLTLCPRGWTQSWEQIL